MIKNLVFFWTLCIFMQTKRKSYPLWKLKNPQSWKNFRKSPFVHNSKRHTALAAFPVSRRPLTCVFRDAIFTRGDRGRPRFPPLWKMDADQSEMSGGRVFPGKSCGVAEGENFIYVTDISGDVCDFWVVETLLSHSGES